MAKTDNLTDFLTGVAGAIRTKKGTTALINPQDFESEIGSIDTAKPEQTKTLTVTENGTQTVKPDTGKVLSGVTVTTNVPATSTEEKTVDLSMTSGNQVITPTSGKVISKATIKKPATMIPANIRKNVNIGGVVGTMVEEHHTEQEKTAALNMDSGNQIVNADSGKVMTRVTITKPTSMVANNIRKGTDIGGVVGTMEEKVPEQTKTVTLSLASGNQSVSPDAGKVLSGITIKKPATLLPANIRKSTNIAGVVGTMEERLPEEAPTVELAMSEGDLVISATTGKVMTKVTVTKPKTLIPANIRKSTDIGGVTGTMEERLPEQTKTIDLSLASGNQNVAPDSGKVLTGVTINKPTTLVASNIKSGVNIAGVAGSLTPAKTEQAKTLTVIENGTQIVKPDTGQVLSSVTVKTNVPATPTEEKSVDLAMADGNQVITPTSGKNLIKVTVKKPATLVGSNIKSGVSIGGVAGSLEEKLPEQTKTVDLSMASGNQTVNADDGKVMTSVVVTKPATLAAGNIKSGVNIGGVTGTLSPAKTEQAKTVDLAMASGNQVVSPDSGKVLSSVTITKPTTLVASNIKKGVTIGGVAGSYNPTLETKTVDLAMGSGNQVISKSSGKDGMTQVTITKPSTMLPANIKKGVNIGGVVGSLEAPSLQNSKAVTITSNGTTTITPDAPYDAMKNVSVTVNVAGTGSSGHKVSLYNNSGSVCNIYDAQGVDASAQNFKIWGIRPMGTSETPEINNMIFVSGYVTIDGTRNGYCAKLPTFTGVTPTLVSGGLNMRNPLVYKLNGDCVISDWKFFCLIKGTLITLADGSKKPVEDITYDDELLVWNFYKGCFDKAKPRWIKIAQTASVYNKLTFDNGATLGLVGEGGTQGYHRIFNEQARLFTHTGVPETPIGTITFAEDCTKPTLVKQELVHEEVEFYNVITETHFNLFANGILTSCKNSNKYYIENMKYVTDKELMTDAEIEQDMLNREPIKLKKEIK